MNASVHKPDCWLDHANRSAGAIQIAAANGAGNMGITTEIKSISPDEAAYLLTKNTRNRPLDERRAKRLASAIQRGEWALNGDAIRISNTGVILDGQHRLKAISLSGETVQTLVVSGLPDSVFDTIDVGGRARTAGDVFSIRGEKNFTVIASITRMIHKYELTGNPYHGSHESNPSVKEMEAVLARHPDIRRSASFIGSSKWCRKYMSPSLGGFAHYVFSAKNQTKAEEFFAQLESGAGLDAGSPVLLLRDRLADASTSKEKLKDSYRAALAFKSFRLHLDDAFVKNLRVRTDGDAPERNLFAL